MQSIINKFYGHTTPSLTLSSFQPHSVSNLKIYPSNSLCLSNTFKPRTHNSIPIQRDIPILKTDTLPYHHKVIPIPPTKDNNDKLKLMYLENKLSFIENQLIENKTENANKQRTLQEQIIQTQMESQMISDKFKKLQEEYFKMRSSYHQREKLPYYQPIPIKPNKENYYEEYKGDGARRKMVQKQLKKARWKLREHYDYYDDINEDYDNPYEKKIMMKGRKGLKRPKKIKISEEDNNEEVEINEGIPHQVISQLQKRNNVINDILNEIKNDFQNIKKDVNLRLNEMEQQHLNNKENFVNLLMQRKTINKEDNYLNTSNNEEIEEEEDKESYNEQISERTIELPRIDEYSVNRYNKIEDNNNKQLENEEKYELPIVNNTNKVNVSNDKSGNNSKRTSFYTKTNNSQQVNKESTLDRNFYQTKGKKVKLMEKKEDISDENKSKGKKSKSKSKKRKAKKKKEKKQKKEENENKDEDRGNEIKKKKKRKKKKFKKLNINNQDEE